MLVTHKAVSVTKVQVLDSLMVLLAVVQLPNKA